MKSWEPTYINPARGVRYMSIFGTWFVSPKIFIFFVILIFSCDNWHLKLYECKFSLRSERWTSYSHLKTFRLGPYLEKILIFLVFWFLHMKGIIIRYIFAKLKKNISGGMKSWEPTYINPTRGHHAWAFLGHGSYVQKC